MNEEEENLGSMRTPVEEIDASATTAATEPGFDDSPRKFRKDHPGDSFTGSSGVLFEQAMAQTRMAVCLCDPKQPDIPIVFANRAFRALTGYPEEEIIGRNCRFLQGPQTAQEPIEKIRAALKSEDVVVVELLNYRRDGTPFWNALHLGPIYNSAGDLMYFFGSQWDVSDVRAARAEERHAKDMARELSHRMKNMFSVISGIVNLTGRMRGIPKEAREINERVQALGRAYETTLDEASSGTIEIGPAIRAILAPYDMDDSRLKLIGNGLRVPFGLVSSVGLTLHELAANATKHGAWTRDNGQVEVEWGTGDAGNSRDFILDWRESDGPSVTRPDRADGAGNVITDRVLKYQGGSIEREWRPEGLHAKVRIPVRGEKA